MLGRDQTALDISALAGEHFTPREAIALRVNLLLIEDDEALAKPGIVRKRSST